MKTKFLFFGCLAIATMGIASAQNNVMLNAGTYVTSTPGTSNTCVGTSAGLGITTGYSNLFLGINAGRTTTIGTYNIFAGEHAGFDNLNGNDNVFIGGRGAGQRNVDGIDNIFIGKGSGNQNVNGASNTFIGTFAGNTSLGNLNTFIGFGAGQNSTTSDSNVFIGRTAGSAANGKYNIAVGTNSYGLGSGEQNTILGHNSGSGLTTGSGNTFLGQVNVTNGAVSNTIILADGYGRQRLYIDGVSGFSGFGLPNNTIPTNILEISSGSAGSAGLTFTDLDNTYVSPNFNSAFLTVNSVGAVVLENAINLYTHDGQLSGDRIVDMNNKKLIFDTQADGRIYVGDVSTSPFGVANFPAVTGVDNNYKLLVEGGILTEKVKVALHSGSNWADYVFADNYKLMPLNEVESFVKANKHLPGIDSAKDLEACGLDLAEMQSKQMEKIEELTLHLIEQNKQLEQQRNEIDELKVMVKLLMQKK